VVSAPEDGGFAARNSVFDINDAAPARHTGTITYIFIPQ